MRRAISAKSATRSGSRGASRRIHPIRFFPPPAPSQYYAMMDNVTLSYVPEPSSAILGLLGGLALLARRRRA